MAEQDDTPIFEPYSVKRRKQERQGQPAVYQYDELPPTFRRQVVSILDRAIGTFTGRRGVGTTYVGLSGLHEASPHDVWLAIHNRICDEGVAFDLAPREPSYRDKVVSYLMNPGTSTDAGLDAIQFAFRIAAVVDRLDNHYRRSYDVQVSSAQAMQELNQRFRQHDLGYQFVDGEIIRSDDEFLHVEAIEPAVNLLKTSGFAGALEEFMHAHRHYRGGDFPHAVHDANNAFESTMKTIAKQIGITLNGTETAGALIRELTRRQIIPNHQRSGMEVLAVLRSQTPGAGHGGGPDAEPVLEHTARYALNLSATNILFLIQAWQTIQGDR